MSDHFDVLIHEENESHEKKKKLNKKKLIILGFAALISLVAIGFLIPYIVKPESKPVEKTMSIDTEPKRIIYDPPIPEHEDLNFTEEEHRQLSRALAAQGMVLGTNNGNALPLQPTDRVVLFGKGTNKTIYGGTGSGEVYQKGTSSNIVPVQILDGVAAKGDEKKIHYILNDKGFEIGEGLTDEDVAAFGTKDPEDQRSVGILTISRKSGEGGDRKNDTSETGTLLSEGEKATYSSLIAHFDLVVVVLNVGSVMELEDWPTNEKTTILISFLPGMEAGNAIADVLVGDAYPSGHLTDTWAKTIADYPTTATFMESIDYVKYKEGLFMGYRYFEDDADKQAKVVFPFGHGLSYTTFTITDTQFTLETDKFTVTSKVTNTGSRPGRQVVQIYVEKPQNENFIKVKRELIAFVKTKEIPAGESETVTMTFNRRDLASYDDTGATGNPACYVLEAGSYNFYVGASVADTRDPASLAYTYTQDELEITEKLSTRLRPKDKDVEDANHKPNFTDIMTIRNIERLETEDEMLKIKSDLNNNGYKEYGDSIAVPTDKIHPINFKTVLEGKNTLEELCNEMTNEEMAYLTYGHGGKIKSGTGNIGGYFNAEILGKYLIPNGDTCDGPAGIRQAEWFLQSTAWPCSTALASTFDVEVLEKVGNETGKEGRYLNLSFWLAPGMNIHRSPLCGRNFEYYSEDPLVTGKMAAAISKGLQSRRVSITLKHFAFNDKEENRGGSGDHLPSDSRMAERVAREIYLKGFEIAVKEGHPWAIMSSYNRMNGMKTAESYDLLTGILRNEWGFDGLVMTDWGSNSRIERELQGGGNVKMPGNGDGSTSVLNGLRNGMISRKDLIRNSVYILTTLSRTAAIDILFREPTNITKISSTEKTRIKMYSKMFDKHPGISYEECKDEDGGFNPTYTDHNTWITLYIENEVEGYRNARIRFSSTLPGFGVAFRKFDQQLGVISNLESTGDWQNWQTSPDFSLYLPEGKYEITLLMLGYDYGGDKVSGNVNWVEIDPPTNN